VVATDKVRMRGIVKRVAEMSTVSSADAMAVVEAFLTVIPDVLGQGNIVDLGEFGSFWLRIKTEGEEDEDDVGPANVTGVLPRFRPGKEFKKKLQGLVFKKA